MHLTQKACLDGHDGNAQKNVSLCWLFESMSHARSMHMGHSVVHASSADIGTVCMFLPMIMLQSQHRPLLHARNHLFKVRKVVSDACKTLGDKAYSCVGRTHLGRSLAPHTKWLGHGMRHISREHLRCLFVLRVTVALCA